MGFDIVLGRSGKDYRQLGNDASMLIGKHYVTMGKTVSLANDIYVDVNGSHVVLICGKRGGGKCLHEDTLINLNDGRVVKIKDLEKESGQIMGLDTDLKIKGLQKEEFFKRKANDLVSLKLKSGKELKLTKEHPLLTINGWIPVNELKKGSRVATPRIIPSFGTCELRECEVKILAYLISEGHLSNGFVLFSNLDNNLVEDFKKSVKEFDSSLKIGNHGKGSYMVSSIKKNYIFNEDNALRDSNGTFIDSQIKPQKSSLTKWLINQGIYDQLSSDKIIPECIFKAPKRQIALFLNRLFSGDGSIYKKKYSETKKYWRVSYSSSSRILIKQVHDLLLRFGILSKIRTKKINYSDGKNTNYEIEINRQNTITFIREIGFFSAKQQVSQLALKESENIIFNPNLDTIPKEVWKNFKPKNWATIGKLMNYSNPKSLRSSISYSPSRQKLMQIALIENNLKMLNLAASDIFWDEIESITPLIGEYTVYDITVPGVHNFIANDVIVHNSYTMGVMAEAILGLPKEVRENIGMIFFDTMGLYWTTKYPNYKQSNDLMDWNLGPQGFEKEAVVYCPAGYFDYYKEKNVPVDKPFTIDPADLSSSEWCMVFGISSNEEVGVCIERAINQIKKRKSKYSIDDIKKEIESDKTFGQITKLASINRFEIAESWGLFSENATPLSELVKKGVMSIMDISIYVSAAAEFDIRSLVIGLICRRLLNSRMVVRKTEELSDVEKSTTYFSKAADEKDKTESKEIPIVWVFVDEAHEFLPPAPQKTLATDALVQILREGRQPGVNLVLATQQPGKIHTDAITQADIILSHRLTADLDIKALEAAMSSFSSVNLFKMMNDLPKMKGSAIVMDDLNENVYPMQVRPRVTWHGGGSPSILSKDYKTKNVPEDY